MSNRSGFSTSIQTGSTRSPSSIIGATRTTVPVASMFGNAENVTRAGLPDGNTGGVSFKHVPLYPDRGEIVDLKRPVLWTNDLAGNDVKSDNPAGRRGANREAREEGCLRFPARQVGLLQSGNLLFV